MLLYVTVWTDLTNVMVLQSRSIEQPLSTQLPPPLVRSASHPWVHPHHTSLNLWPRRGQLVLRQRETCFFNRKMLVVYILFMILMLLHWFHMWAFKSAPVLLCLSVLFIIRVHLSASCEQRNHYWNWCLGEATVLFIVDASPLFRRGHSGEL